MTSSDPIRIVVADDHTLLRETLCETLLVEEDFAVCGVAGTGDEVVAVTGDTHPDVVLLDLGMPQHDPLDTVARLHRVSPRPKVIVLTVHDRADLVRRLIDAGVASYLSKHVSRKYLVTTIRSAHEGQGVTIAVPGGFTVGGGAEQSIVLSPRELEVLTLVADALSNRQIATRLSITEGTVKRHLRNVFEKLGASSRMEAVRTAREAALITPESSYL
ncbi:MULTISPECIES: response regulator transcription factor [unclassified Streptomyces]|uniref:Response regulator transcription factor n=1 Tax=Streptomyces millisiae TaxID=3075542 RepID=A0ABU2LIE2_9ACTN|nr:response regulator transcription factor [Streptomyces sp. DSM 44918]MDT0317342.1 response regulator transcription factor [Streptomyces sp. DSM 44918]